MTENNRAFDDDASAAAARNKKLLIAVGIALLTTFVVTVRSYANTDDATCYEHDDDETTSPYPILPVLGRKGDSATQRFIELSLNACSLADNVGESRATKKKGRRDLLEACGFQLMEATVGRGDESDDGSKNDLIQVLKNLQKGDFYPPLIVVGGGSVDHSDLEWLNGIRTIFPDATLAVGGDMLHPSEPITTFPLRDQVSTTTYAKDVLAIVDYYNENLKPGRTVNLSSHVFTDEIKRIPRKKPQKKIQFREHAEPRTKRILRKEKGEEKIQRETGRCFYADAMEDPLYNVVRDHLDYVPKWVTKLVDLNDALLAELLGLECVPETKEETIPYESVVFDLYRYDTIREYKDVLERQVIEIWQGMADGSSFFLRKEVSPWRMTESKLLHEQDTEPVLSNEED